MPFPDQCPYRLSVPALLELTAYLILANLLSGCSIVMALSGHRDPSLQYLHVGSTREVVEMELGPPKESHETSYGARTDIYEYEVNNEPNAPRAVMYLIYDVFTFGIAEIVFTFAELNTGEKKRLPIYYGVDGTVAGINETAPETPSGPTDRPLPAPSPSALESHGPETEHALMLVRSNCAMTTWFHPV